MTSGVRPPRASRAETRQRLLAAAFDVFAAKGFGRTRIDDICRASGFTKGAFYSNFSTLEELFFALYREQSQLGTQHTLRVLANIDTDPGAAITQWANELPIRREWLLINTDFVTHAARNPSVAAEFARERSQLRAEIAARIAAWIESSGRPLPPTLASAPQLARAIVSIYDGVIAQLLLDFDTAAVRQQFSAILHALIRPH